MCVATTMWSIFIVSLLLHCNSFAFAANRDDLISDIFGENTEATTSKDPNMKSCECVPYYLCENGTINNNGEGIIDIRVSDCPHYLQVCCGEEQTVTVPPSTTPKPPFVPKGCGYRNPDGVGFRIKNQINSEAEFGEFPWMVAIFYEEPMEGAANLIIYQCGGSLIHSKVVLTAAHCIKSKQKKLKIRAGEWDTQTTNELLQYQNRDVESIKIHPKYYAGALYNDVALLFLKTPVDFDEHINVACLPPPNFMVNDARCFSSGWGKDVFGKEGKYQVILKKVDLPMVRRPVCEAALRKTRLGKHFQLHSSFVCAGGENGKDTCKGDGGSPLVCPIQNQKERYFQVGMVAWGIGCGENGIPGVYVNVPAFRQWIDEELKRRNLDIKAYQY